MRVTRTAAFGLVVLLCLVTTIHAQQGPEIRPSPKASSSQTIGPSTTITIEYSRPGVKGREVWGDLVPYGKVWRSGANEATMITFSEDVLIEGQKLPKGAYGLFTIPSETEWTVIFNKTAEQWGSFNYDATQDALRIKVQPGKAEHQEWLSYSFEDLEPPAGPTSATVVLRWKEVAIPFKVAVAAQ